ncbi:MULTISPECIES: single-stranded DNA-binding protein [Serratia]|uniref:Single-stranded DNA-binding protein n=1 Tax=Serratia quinivorans TaxID=137545 RepID=A0A380A5V4_9GAMM|nr:MULTISPECIES: single-stranded DNA-binding protein [Serratia]RYM57994.1 single-stranded DNA-binding protein [Serratia proteamaculans]CAI2022646.1 single-stranded DNA-binding protein [Serratia quinivorans]SUI73895.1 single-stranded DNA-binding protein [Serratia quinivorans]
MTAQIAAYGRLVVSLPCHSAENGEAPFWLGVVAFGKQADALARHSKGDMVSVSGNMQVNQWTAQDGSTASGYQVVADSVVSARTVRPGSGPANQKTASDRGGKPEAQQAGQRPAPYQQPEDFDQTPPYDAPFRPRTDQ